MRTYLTLTVFTAAVSLAYTGVAQLLPQLENHPPATVELGSNIGPEELAAAGAGVFAANCAQCHKMGQKDRCPDLSQVGAGAKSRAEARAKATGHEYTEVDYLVESLCKPGEFLAEGFANIMPPQGKVLTGGQILAVVAFLQDQGGQATVKGTDAKPVERFACSAAQAPAAPVAGGGAAEPVGPPDQVATRFGCSACHRLDGPERLVGPSLQDVGRRLTAAALYEALLDPDASLAAGTPPYPGGLMKATLEGNGFYSRMTAADYKALVAWLAAKKGG